MEFHPEFVFIWW